MTITKRVKVIQLQSKTAWEMAIDTAGPDYQGGSDTKQESMQDLADECDTYYDIAVGALEVKNYELALDSLLEARSLESKGGDCSHADSAIKELNAMNL